MIETGNALIAGAATRGWMVGDLAAWDAASAASSGAGTGSHHQPVTASTLRQSQQVEVKFYIHPAGDHRAAWANDARYTTLTIIIDGELHIEYRDTPDAPIQAVHLNQRGDYAIWRGEHCSHTWHTDAGCTLVTVRWPREEQGVDQMQ